MMTAVTAVGILIGAMSGTRILARITNKQVRRVFLAILAYFGLRMVLRGLGREGLLPITSVERNVLSVVFATVVISLFLAFGKRYEETADYIIQLYRAQPENPGRVENFFIGITSNLLKYGVLLSIALLVLGLVLMVVHNGGMGIPLSKIIDPSANVNTSVITGCVDWRY